MKNISIDDVMDYIIIVLTDNPFTGHELTDCEMSILLDIVRDARMPEYHFFRSLGIPMVSGRKNLSRSKEEEMSDICELLNHSVKYQPERISKLLLNKRPKKI
jgi:hypothetical protein